MKVLHNPFAYVRAPPLPWGHLPTCYPGLFSRFFVVDNSLTSRRRGSDRDEETSLPWEGFSWVLSSRATVQTTLHIAGSDVVME